MLIYATPVDLDKWINGDAATGATAPADAAKQIRSASVLVRRTTSRDIYDIDSNGYPTDPKIVEAMTEATCSLAATYSALGLDFIGGVAGTDRVVLEKGLGSARVKYADPGAREAARVALLSGAITDEAYDILRNAGLASAGVMADTGPRSILAPGPWPVQ